MKSNKITFIKKYRIIFFSLLIALALSIYMLRDGQTKINDVKTTSVLVIPPGESITFKKEKFSCPSISQNDRNAINIELSLYSVFETTLKDGQKRIDDQLAECNGEKEDDYSDSKVEIPSDVQVLLNEYRKTDSAIQDCKKIFEKEKKEHYEEWNTKVENQAREVERLFDKNKCVSASKNDNNASVTQVVQDFIKARKQTVQYTKDIGNKFTYIQTIGKNCGSCHAKMIYVFDKNNKKVFELQADDPIFSWSDDKTFAIIEPIRKDNEPLCCATTHQTRVFRWNGRTFMEISPNR